MENNDDGRRAGSGETFYGTHESENNMVMSEKVSNFVRISVNCYPLSQYGSPRAPIHVVNASTNQFRRKCLSRFNPWLEVFIKNSNE